jgi:hypothetical protein
MTLLEALTQRWLIVALAIAGAALVMAADRLGGGDTLRSQQMTRLGYGLTMASIALFIVAGFLSDQ